MGLKVVGYEKAWLALLGGGTVTAATTLSLWLASIGGAVTAPDEAAIAAAITGLVASVFAALGAFLGTNTPTEPAPPSDGNPEGVTHEEDRH